MNSVFFFSEAERLDFLQSVLNTYGCAYVCLWFYSSSSNRLLFLDGLCDVPNQQAISSLGLVGNFDQRLFDQYRGLEFDVTSDNGVPGLAFRNHQYACLELQQSDLLRLARTDLQRRFFHEARIKTAVFIGCGNGEVELGFSVISQGAEIQADVMRNLFPEEFSRQSHPAELKYPSSSSSSSLRSLSTARSPESTSLPFANIPGTSLLPEMLPIKQETEHDAIVRAFIHVISSPSSSSNNSAFHQQNLPNNIHPEGTSAFTRYIPSEMSSKPGLMSRKQSLLKRSFELFRGLHYMRNMRERYQTGRPSSTQLLHMISERRRRERLNQNFQALRSLLPPGTKKDKGSILTAAKETLNSLMAEIEKITNEDQKEEAQMKSKQLLTDQEMKISPSTERFSVRVSDVPGSSSSDERFIHLQVTVRGQIYSQVEMLIRLLEFLKGVQIVSLVSVEANTHIAQGAAVNEATLRLKIEGSEWDEAAFREAVRRVIADLAG
ncbi:putative transcription factor bHLH041 [Neltuma alba]|uniref:putative transcription factor bHLH041 n=1 Tax=Neltuma alba TaxID=207710 RepID=UPI0010A4C314|nr:putative transcription factor bHLH041 [Prosopis alba]